MKVNCTALQCLDVYVCTGFTSMSFARMKNRNQKLFNGQIFALGYDVVHECFSARTHVNKRKNMTQNLFFASRHSTLWSINTIWEKRMSKHMEKIGANICTCNGEKFENRSNEFIRHIVDECCFQYYYRLLLVLFFSRTVWMYKRNTSFVLSARVLLCSTCKARLKTVRPSEREQYSTCSRYVRNTHTLTHTSIILIRTLCERQRQKWWGRSKRELYRKRKK